MERISLLKPRDKFVSLRVISLLALCVFITFMIAMPGRGASTVMYYVVVLLSALAFLTNNTNVVVSKYVIIMALLGVFMTITVPFSPAEEWIKLYYLEAYWKSVIMAFFVTNIIKCREDFYYLMISVIIGAALLSINVYTTYGLENLIFSDIRIDNTITNQNRLGMYCAFGIAFSIERLVSDRKHWLLYITAIIVIAPAMMFTGSRKAIAILVVAIIVLAFSAMTKDRAITSIKIFLLTIAIIVAIILLIYYVPAFVAIKNRFADMLGAFGTSNDTSASDDTRFRFIEEGLRSFASSPFIGHGFCYSYSVFGTYAHNNFVELLMNHGFIGASLYYAPYLMLISNATKFKNQNRSFASLLLMIIAAILVCEMGVVTYYERFITIMIASMITSLEREKQSEKGDLDG